MKGVFTVDRVLTFQALCLISNEPL